MRESAVTQHLKSSTWLKRKWHHIAFWTFYTLFWYFLFLFWGTYKVSWMDIPNNLIYLIAHAGITYLNFYVLMPKFLHKKRYFLYAVLLIGSMLFFGSIISLYFYLIYQPGEPLEFFLSTANSSLGSVSTTVLVTMVIKIVREWRKSQKRNQDLQKENIETELKLLKAQLNPHFMFNAINNIYFLIRKDPDLAEKSLASFSDMLRYQLYECNEEKVLLTKEIEHTSNFIKLAKLRKGDKLNLSFEIQEDLNGLLIAPFLIFPLVENAFKHVSVENGNREWINIKVSLEKEILHVFVSNSRSHSSKSKDLISFGGIGLVNLKKRLDLSYPGTYKLNISESDESFEVDMKVPVLKQA